MNRRYRLSDSGRFRQVRQAGTSFSHPFFILCLLPNELDHSRCGFTASRKIGNAVARNRARRRMREVARHLWHLIQPGWDLVWVARPAINSAEFADLEVAGLRLLGRAGVLGQARIEDSL